MQLAVVNLSIIHSYKDYSRIAVIFELQVKEKNVLSLQEEQRRVKLSLNRLAFTSGCIKISEEKVTFRQSLQINL